MAVCIWSMEDVRTDQMWICSEDKVSGCTERFNVKYERKRSQESMDPWFLFHLTVFIFSVKCEMGIPWQSSG